MSCRYPEGAGAVLIVELDGPAADVEAQTAAVRAICTAEGAYEIRAAQDAAERAAIWTGRKSAFAAVGRISPAYIVQDGVVPRTALPKVLDRISELSAEHGHPGRQRLPRRRRQPAPARAVRRRRAGRAGGGREAVRHDPGPVHRARRLDHRRARRRRGQVALHAQDVRRRRPGHHAAAAVRLRPGAACAIPARCSRRRGCAGRSPASAAPRTRSSPPARSISSDVNGPSASPERHRR